MSSGDRRVTTDSVSDGDGNVIADRQIADRLVAEQTAKCPPPPGMYWSVTFRFDGQANKYTLCVDRDWYDAYAPERPGTLAPDPTAPESLGRLAYAAWFRALPEVVQQVGTEWPRLPEAFRAPMMAAAAAVWQHGENHGYTTALRATLPSGRLGAAGELDDAADGLVTLLAGQAKDGSIPAQVALDTVAEVLRSRATQLRHDARRHR